MLKPYTLTLASIIFLCAVCNTHAAIVSSEVRSFTNGSSFTKDSTIVGVSGVDTLRVTYDNPLTNVTTTPTATTFRNVNSALALDNGTNQFWFDNLETFDFTVQLFDGGTSGTDVTSNFDIYLTSAVAYGNRIRDYGMTIAGGTGTDTLFSFGGATGTGALETLPRESLDSPYLVDGNTITVGRNGWDAQAFRLEELTFNVIPEPSAFALFAGLGALLLVARRRVRES